MLFPTTAVADFTTAVTDVLSDNIAVVLGVLAFVFGIRFIFRLFNKSTRGHL
ncbi:MAG TPA: hypothetical protein PLU21_01025 [Candidatus Saccharibacteria bacterium]|nr:hypothetical protein [Candidatus Saccharibacteria bacterium]